MENKKQPTYDMKAYPVIFYQLNNSGNILEDTLFTKVVGENL